MKKKATRAKQETLESDGTVAFQVRLDADLHAQLKDAAEVAGISMNQLIQGTLRGALEYLIQGEADIQRHGWVVQRRQKGCVFFGRIGVEMAEEELEAYRRQGKVPPEPDRGELWFGLDFTNRGVVRSQRK